MESRDPKDEAFHLAGDRLGKFVILSELGRGSMGVVYEVFQEDLKRKVALKILPANISLDGKQVRRFHREAESVARLRHDNIIQIYEVGQIENTHYFAMEMVDGQPFGQQPARDREQIRGAAMIARDAARGLAHAHERGVIHRDIKPSNLLVDRAGRVVVTDFGLARVKDSASLTSTDAIVGTPKYMSPEQILPGTYPLDGRADIYSLGATLYEIVAGRPPLEAPSVQAFLRAILEDRPKSPRRSNREVPHDLCTIILRCLEKSPHDRYERMEDLAADIERFLSGERIVARPKGVMAVAMESVRRHKIVAGLSAVAAVALVTALMLTGAVARESDKASILARINDLRAEEDLDLSIQAAEDLSASHPNTKEVQKLLIDLYRKHARNELIRPDVDWASVASDLERAGARASFWHLVSLLQGGRFQNALDVAVALAPGAPERALVEARLDIAKGEFESAIRRLAPLKGDLHAFYYIVLGMAHNLLAQRLAATGGDADTVRRHRVDAVELLARAKKQIKDMHELWLRNLIQLRDFDYRSSLGEEVKFTDAVGEIGLSAGDAWTALSTIWTDMSRVEANNLQEFVRRVLRLSGETAVLPIAEIERLARARLDRPEPGERALGNLLLAVAKLAGAQPEFAEDALAEADELADDTLLPYILWGQSLVWRTKDDMRHALEAALSAVEFARRDFRDIEPLTRHVALLVEEAYARKQETEAKAAREVLEREFPPKGRPVWISDLLTRIAAAAARAAPPR